MRSELWTVRLDPTIGAEMGKMRPAVIISDDAIGRLPLRLVAPLTEWQERYALFPWMVRIEPNRENGLSKPSAVDCFQVRSLAVQRFVERRGRLSPPDMTAIARTVALVVAWAPESEPPPPSDH